METGAARVPSVWPAMLALATVVVLSLSMLGVDVAIDRSTADTTALMVNNALRSVALADDLRYQSHRLLAGRLTQSEIASIAEQIDLDARDYSPLVTYPGEQEQWDRLQALLAHLRHEQPLPDTGPSATLVSEIETAISRLIEINQTEAQRAAGEIGSVHHSGIVIDAFVLVVTLVLVGIVAAMLVRTLRRQRELLQGHLTNLDERQRELAAFASRTAHDMRGPLSPLRGYADLLQLHPDPAVQDNGRRIARATDRMAGIIQDMLELSVHGKPGAGNVAVAPVVREVLDDMRRDLGDAEVTTDVDDVVTACSAGVLGQIVRNLIGNSAKYRSPARRLAVRVEARKQGPAVELAIIDNGIGMDAEAAAHAFDPFYRAPGAASPGHGLGLSIVRRTVDAIGGTVALASTAGEGTRVTVRVPAA